MVSALVDLRTNLPKLNDCAPSKEVGGQRTWLN